MNRNYLICYKETFLLMRNMQTETIGILSRLPYFFSNLYNPQHKPSQLSEYLLYMRFY